MGSDRLEASLRRRVLALAAPLLAVVALAAVAVTHAALDTDDSATARDRGETLLREFLRERAEGDSPATVLEETLGDADAENVAVLLIGPHGERRSGALELPAPLADLERGKCASARDARGRVWRACHVPAPGPVPVEAIAGIDVTAHTLVLQNLAAWMALVVVVASLGLVLAARMAVRRPLRALDRLVRWSEHAFDRDLPEAPPVADTAEIQRLSQAFARLVERLVDALARERATTAHIAHELRTPLTALRAEAEGFHDRADPHTTQRMLADIDRLSRVIDSILVLAAPTGTGARDEIVNLADLARALAPSGTVVEAPDEALVEADPRLLELTLRNLLENAQKFSGHPAHTIRIAQLDGRAHVTVSDDGPGVDDSQLDRIFERYWRATSDGAGSGLGLALVRAVAIRYGGWARAANAASGKGLDVVVALGPLKGWHGEAPR